MQGTSDIHQLELIYTLCGSPIHNPNNTSMNPVDINMMDTKTHITSTLDGTVYNVYHELPGWTKYPIANTYPPNLMHRFQKMSPLFVNLVSQMLMLLPSQRITAGQALNHDFFWESEIPKSELLPKFINIHCGHEYEARMKRNAEVLARQQEHASFLAKQSQHFQPQYDRSNIQSRNNTIQSSNNNNSVNNLPTLQPSVTNSNNTNVLPQSHNNLNRAHTTHGTGQSKPNRSSQGLTKGFSVVRNPSTTTTTTAATTTTATTAINSNSTL